MKPRKYRSLLFKKKESSAQSESRKDTDTSCLVEKLLNRQQEIPGWILSALIIAICQDKVNSILQLKREMPIQDVTQEKFIKHWWKARGILLPEMFLVYPDLSSLA